MHAKLKRKWMQLAIPMLSGMCLFTGCSILTDIQSTTANQDGTHSQVKPADEAAIQAKIANPPARTIRFDGHEVVLGDAESNAMTPEKFMAALQPLVAQKRWLSAQHLITHHRELAERILSERWAIGGNDPSIQAIAKVLDQRSTRSDTNWSSLIRVGIERAAAARAYQDARNAFAAGMQTTDPTNEQASQLQQLALSVGHPLVRTDSLRLLGLRELVAGRHGWAEALCRQAAETARNSGNDLLAADLALMVAESARRGEQATLSAQAWQAAINLHLASMPKDHPVDVSFWLMAEHIRPQGAAWPNELITSMSQHMQSVGCTSDGGPEMVLWTSVAAAQYERGEMQAALVSFKKAETVAAGNNIMWLRIAQAQCLAGLGQGPAAAALLSGPATAIEPAIAAAATAAMGSTKLQAGAYQQGAQLLNKALTQYSGTSWPTRSQALADLAIAQLIIGETEPGLEALHAVQAQFIQSGNRRMLVRSLENELRLLEHEQRSQEAEAIKQRIQEIEQS